MSKFIKKTESDYKSRYILNYIRKAKESFLDELIKIDDLIKDISFVVDMLILII